VTGEIYGLEVHHETDVFASRQAARDVATAVGVEGQDVIRVATALSEVTRDLLAAGGGRVSVTSVAPDLLRVTLTGDASGPGTAWHSASGLDAARRLMDAVTVAGDEGGRTVVVLEKRARAARPVDDHLRRELRRRLSDTAGRTSVDELRLQNRDLVAVLEEVQARKEELERVNAELEETNKGVLALYGELSDELERTNQGVVALYAEIDDKNRLLAEASESKTRFLNNISHELRTPGNSVLGLSRLLLDPAAEPLTDEQRHPVQLISTSAEDLLRLVNELLDLAKAESGRIEVAVDVVDLAALFEELRGTTAPLVTRPGVALVVEPPRGVTGFRTDRTLLRHLLRNLLSNAVKFTESGSVTLTADAGDDGTVTFRVSDTGVGIAEADQAKVFEEFFQVRGTLQATVTGSGLGLPFARRVCRILGGDLRLSSTPGEGTTFSFVLPTAGPEADAVRPG
jgi:signal transduction histidine kinase